MSKSPREFERMLWAGFSVALLFGTLLMERKLQKLATDASLKADVAIKQQATLREANKKLVAELEQARSSYLPGRDLSDLKRRGLTNPASDLIADLQRHKSLIPYKAVLGGTMGFYGLDDIRILSPRWVVAGFDDGHITGQALLKYKVSQPGKVSWIVLDSYMDK